MLPALLDILRPSILIPWLLGMLFGIFVGATPGLTATMAVALIVPISFQLEPTAGLALIIGVSFTAIFAGDIPATYLRIPGTPASAAAVLDGHELARQGRSGLALMLDLLCSALGGLIGVGLLILVARPLANFSLLFSDFEFFWLAVLGLSLSATVSKGNTYQGLLSAGLGLLLATIGRDEIGNAARYTFGILDLFEGLNFIPVMIGLFGLAEVIRSLGSTQPLSGHVAGAGNLELWESLRVMWRHKWLIIQSSLLGTFIGALPGAGADIAAWGAYGLAQTTSRHPDRFGQGSLEGVVAPTSANNAAVAGAWIPALAFNVPGDAVTAIVLSALMMYDIVPGPQLFSQVETIYPVFMVAIVTQFLLIPTGLIGIQTFRWLLRLPRRAVLVGVVLFSIVGSYAIRNSVFDIYVMLIFGLVGVFLESQRVPLAPLILGLILGPLLERTLRAGLIGSNGDWTPLFTRPLCLLMISMLLLSLVVLPLLRNRKATKGHTLA